jgi:hypothetical protein
MKNNLIYAKIVEVLQYIVQAQDEVARRYLCQAGVSKVIANPFSYEGDFLRFITTILERSNTLVSHT